MAQSSQLEVTNKCERSKAGSERVLVIKEQTLRVNYNLGKFQACSHEKQWELTGSKEKLRVPWKDLGLSAAIPTPPLASVSPTESRPTSHPQNGSGRHSKVISWSGNECVLSVLSELIPWALLVLVVLQRAALGAGLSTPGHSATTCGVCTPKVQSQVWRWLLSVQEWELE